MKPLRPLLLALLCAAPFLAHAAPLDVTPDTLIERGLRLAAGDGEGDLVITDVVMPDENGLDLVPRIRKLRPELRVIVMSAQNTLLTAVNAS